jgi:hypothetical protein
MKLGKYRHYKWKEYEVVAVAKHSETWEDLVIYKALYSCDEYLKWQIRARPKEMFEDEVIVNDNKIKRFKYIW